jgi:succinylarginine dihydrolase
VSPFVRHFFDRVVAEDNPVGAVHYIDVNASMKNGGGPACLRLRVPLTDDERAAIGARVFVDDALLEELESWIRRNYRDRLVADDLADPALLEECRRALDELTRILRLGSVYDFQRSLP